MSLIEFILLLISGILIGAKEFNIPIYITFILISLIRFNKYNKSKDITNIIAIMLYGIIIPDNYIIIFILMLEFLVLIIKKREIKITTLSLFFIIYLIFNILLHEFKIPNFLFSILYYSTTFFSYFVFKKVRIELREKIEDILKIISDIIIIELITIITYAIFHINIIKASIDFDWVVGTFGKYQGNILLFFMLFSFLLFTYHYRITKEKKDLIYISISIIISIFTGSIALLILFLLSYIVITIILKKGKGKVSKIVLSISAIAVFICVTPNWIKEYIINLRDYNYLVSHISKIESYETTFITIPKEDKMFLLFGNGIGNYSSRAALTCTGEYINGYSKFFNESMSKYTKTYIYPNLMNVMKNKLGSMDTAYSSIITIQGELGIIGILFFIVYWMKLFISNKEEVSRTFLLFFILSCFIENYLEFAKVICVVFFLYFIVENEEKEKKNDKKRSKKE